MDAELLADFLAETAEGMEELDLDMVRLEQNPNDKDLLSKIFRIIHTIKGTCGFIGLPRLEKLTHSAENVLGKYRDGELEVTEQSVSLIFETFDKVKFILDALEETAEEPDGNDDALIARLDAINEGRDPDAADEEGVSDQPLNPTEELDRMVAELEAQMAAEAQAESSSAAASSEEPSSEEAGALSRDSDMDQTEDQLEEHLPEKEPAAEKELPPAMDRQSARAAAEDIKKQAEATAQAVAASKTLRVSVDVLEGLMTMVSELVLTRNQLLQILRHQSESEFATPLQRLNQVVSELQEGVMQTRMQPIGNAWNKLPRIVRDISVDLGKKIDLRMKGQETELDRQVLELIRDPLTHMIRNSADHGIEGPEERKAAGKPETGTIGLKAFHEGGHIIIEISDDGRGLSVQKIRDKALQRDLVTESELEGMSDQQIQQFIFKPGFSTAEQVTNVSGRGVGMDVVRTNIEKIGGNIELKSIEGKGSTFTIKIPLTLAIISALIVEAGGERFALPQISVQELVRASSRSEYHIEYIKGAPVMRLRDTLLPLVSLGELLGLDGQTASDDEASGDEAIAADEKGLDNVVPFNKEGRETIKSESQKTVNNDAREEHFIVVTRVGSNTFGIIVDRIFDTEEIVVKPVTPLLRDLDLYSGNTILGDGSVIMILDPNGISAAMSDVTIHEGAEEQGTIEDTVEQSGQATTLLVFKAAGGAPKVVPLSLIQRLENIDMSTVEMSNDRHVVQYRGQLMPLVPFDPADAMLLEGCRPVLVFAEGGRSMGLVVDEIVDIVEDYLDVELTSRSDNGVLGSAVIAGKSMDIVDVPHFLVQAHESWFQAGTRFAADNGGTAGDGMGKHNARRVMLVDDSAFVRNILAPLLGAAGYSVTAARDAEEALSLLEKHDFDVIISDIDMPGMNGFELAQKIKDDPKWRDIPLLAFSSHAAPEDKDRGREAGFDDHVSKFDRDALLRSLSSSLSGHEAAKTG